MRRIKVIDLSLSIASLTNELLLNCESEKRAQRLRTAIHWLRRAEYGKDLLASQVRILNKQ